MRESPSPKRKTSALFFEKKDKSCPNASKSGEEVSIADSLIMPHAPKAQAAPTRANALKIFIPF